MLAIKEGFFRMLRPGHGVPMERSIKAVRAEYRRSRAAAQASAAQEGAPEDADLSEEEAPDEHPPEGGGPEGAPSGSARLTRSPWRAEACNEASRSGDPGKMARFDPTFEPDMPNILTPKSQKEYEDARRHVVAFTCKARDKDGALEQFAHSVERSMTELCRNSTYDIMNISHIMVSAVDRQAGQASHAARKP